MRSKVYKGDCRDSMLAMRKGSVDAIITDPPYGLEFMGRGWDHGVPGRSFWSAALRVAKPGAHLFAFGGTRLHHRMMCAIEDAGWEIRDCLMWMYGSGFPKSLDVSRAVDEAVGAKRRVVGTNPNVVRSHASKSTNYAVNTGSADLTVPASPLAQQFDGYGTSLKPAWEPIILAMKPTDGTFVENAQRHGLAGLNIDAGRIGSNGGTRRAGKATEPNGAGWTNMKGHGTAGLDKGRWPANAVLDDEAAAELDAGQPISSSPVSRPRTPDPVGGSTWNLGREGGVQVGHGDSGGPSRFFYNAKASKRDRAYTDADGNEQVSDHPTVKPIDLMRWIVRMAAPPRSNVRILDPFMGSGSTGVACALEGVAHFVGCERVEHFIEIAEARIAAAVADIATPTPTPKP